MTDKEKILKMFAAYTKWLEEQHDRYPDEVLDTIQDLLPRKLNPEHQGQTLEDIWIEKEEAAGKHPHG